MIKKLMVWSFVLGLSFSGLCAADDPDALGSLERAPVRSMITADFISLDDGDIRLSGGDILVSNITCRNLYVKTSGTCRLSGRIETADCFEIDAHEVICEGGSFLAGVI